MSNLSIHFLSKNESPRKLTFKMWMDRGFRAAVIDEKQKIQVIDFLLPMLEGLRWNEDYFKDLIPVSVKPCRLVPPPIRLNEKDAQLLLSGQDLCAKMDRPWELIYQQVVWPDEETRRRITKYLEAMKPLWEEEYERRKQELAGRTFKWYRETFDRKARLEGFRKWKQDKLDGLDELYANDRKWSPKELPEKVIHFVGYLKLTPEYCMANDGEVLQICLHRQWAEECGFDLEQMAEDKKKFLFRLKRQSTLSPESWGSIRTLGWNREMALCAQVQHEIEFHDGSRAFIHKPEINDPFTQSDREAIRRLLKQKSKQTSGGPTSEFLSVKDVAQRTGISTKSIYKYCKDLEIPTKQITDKDVKIFQALWQKGKKKRPAVARANSKR